MSKELFALNTEELLFEERQLYKPTLEEIQSVLQAALLDNFVKVSVKVTECPDLTLPEYGLIDSGLNGSPTLLELGGPPYLLPLVDREKLYHIPDICRKSYDSCCDQNGEKTEKKKKIFAVGAGAGPFPLRNTCCEGIFNMRIEPNGTLINGSYTARVAGLGEDCILERIPDTEPRCAVLLNLFMCHGEPGPVLHVSCKQRKGPRNFIESIRLALQEKYPDKCVGMGGLMLIKAGKVYQHVMRDFSKTPINTLKELNEWLKFYEMPSTLHALGTLITNEIDLDLRLQHFHAFSQSNWDGHYHYDTTPETVEYEAFFNLAERIVRVDKPVITHKFGRD